MPIYSGEQMNRGIKVLNQPLYNEHYDMHPLALKYSSQYSLLCI